jgi:hypothetical protein
MGLVQTFDSFLGATDADKALADAAVQYVREWRQLEHQVAHHFRNASSLANQYGMTALLSKLPEGIAASVEAFRNAITAQWQAMSDDPVPEFPLVPPPPPEQPGE